MPKVKRSRDPSLWFKHIDDPTNSVLPILRNLAEGQAIVLRVGQSTGVWVRFSNGPDGRPIEALKRGDEASRILWSALPTNGAAIDFEIVEVLTQFTSPRTKSARRSKAKAPPQTAITLDAIHTKVEGSVLCLAIDVAWWGGQTGSGKKSTRSETIAYASREGGKWSALSLKRVDLNASYNRNADPFTPNADAEAATLVEGIKEVLDAHSGIGTVVMAVDMPILAKDDGMPRPRKANEEGGEGGKSRQCDSVWMKRRGESPREWKSGNIFAGAPIVPRVRALIAKLRQLGFEVYGQCKVGQKRVVFECFPNEIAWSIGVLGFADGLNLDSLQLYKRLGKKNTPLPQGVFDGVWKHTVDASFETAGVDKDCRSRWLRNTSEWLLTDGVFDEATKIGKTGKQFDDAVDSVLSLSAAVAYALGTAHIHQGTDPEDGHIIGPGRSTRGGSNVATD